MLRAATCVAVVLFAAVLETACGPARAPAGSPCSLATQCDTRLCLFRGDAGVCARRCTDSTGCAGDEVCGRFDFRPIDPDSGQPSGDDNEVVRVCRAPLNAPCGAGQACPAGLVCLGEPMGVCTTPCARDGQCPSGRCFAAAACGLPGSCAPGCDDGAECPRGWYCNTAGTTTSAAGRCEPVTGADDGGGGGGPDGCDAGADDI